MREHWVREACTDWAAATKGEPPFARIGAGLKPLVIQHGWDQVRRAWKQYLQVTLVQYASPQRFAMTYGAWVLPERKEGQERPAQFREVQDGQRMRLEQMPDEPGAV